MQRARVVICNPTTGELVDHVEQLGAGRFDLAQSRPVVFGSLTDEVEGDPVKRLREPSVSQRRCRFFS